MARLFSITKKDRNDKILLVPAADGTWIAEFGSSAASAGILLTVERQYPVELYYSRMDINGSFVMEMDICRDRNELLSSLNWIGSCGHSLESLWEYHSDRPVSKELADIFEAAYLRKCRIVREAADEMYAAFAEEEPIEAPQKSLNAQIQDADSRSFDSGSSCPQSKATQKEEER